MTKSSNGVTLTVPTTARAIGELYLPYTIDFSKYTKLKITYSVNFTGNHSVYYPRISTVLPMQEATNITLFTQNHLGYLFDQRSGSGEYLGNSYSHLEIEYDISSYNASYYLSLTTITQYDAVSSAQSVTIEKVEFS